MREYIHAIVDATDTTTSAAIPLDDATGVSFEFIRTDHSAGKTIFTVNLSNDGTTYVASQFLLSNTATASTANLTRVASYDTGTANASAIYVLDPLQAQSFKYLTVTATETTDGTHNAWVCIQRDR